MDGIAASTDVMHCGDALFIEKPVGRTLIRSFGGIKFRMMRFCTRLCRIFVKTQIFAQIVPCFRWDLV